MLKIKQKAKEIHKLKGRRHLYTLPGGKFIITPHWLDEEEYPHSILISQASEGEAFSTFAIAQRLFDLYYHGFSESIEVLD